MSSAAHLHWCADEGPDRAAWDAFCGEHGIVHRDGNVFYVGDVEITVDNLDLPNIDSITVSTYWMGSAVPDVANLAWALWTVHDGALLEADREVRAVLNERRQAAGPVERAMSEDRNLAERAGADIEAALGALATLEKPGRCKGRPADTLNGVDDLLRNVGVNPDSGIGIILGGAVLFGLVAGTLALALGMLLLTGLLP